MISVLIGLLLLSLLTITFTPKSQSHQNIKWAALWTTLVVFAATLILWSMFDPHASGFQFIERHPWIQSYGLEYHVGIDGISLFLILLITLLFPIIILASWHSIHHHIKSYIIILLLLELFIIGAVSSLNLLLFYLFSESILLPLFLLIGMWGGLHKVSAAFKVLFYSLLGSLFMLLTIIVIFNYTHTLSVSNLQNLPFPSYLVACLWIGLFVAFAFKTPLWPFHTWLLKAQAQAPVGVSIILTSLIWIMGGYGFLRFSLSFFSEISLKFQPYIYVLNIMSILYISLITITQRNLKKLITYSSLLHMGYALLGIFSFTSHGLIGGTFHLISHSLTSAALFLSIHILYTRTHTFEIHYYRGLARKMPLFSICFFILILSTTGCPGTSGFIGEFLIRTGVFSINKFWAAGFVISLTLGFIYGLWVYQRMVLGVASEEMVEHLTPLTLPEKLTLVPLVLLVMWLGIYPKPVLKILETTLEGSSSAFQLSKNTLLQKKGHP